MGNSRNINHGFDCGFEMSERRTALWQQIEDGIFWGAVGIASGFAYGSLMGGVGGFIVGGSLGIAKVGWIAVNVTIVEGNRLSFNDSVELIGEVSMFASEGMRIGALILGTIIGVPYGIYLGYNMIERTSDRSWFSSFISRISR